MLLTLSNPLNLAIVGNPRKRRSAAAIRRAKTQLRSRWKKRTARGGKYHSFAAVVRKKPGKRKHVKGLSWTGRKGTVALFSRKTGRLWGTNPNVGAAIKRTIVAPVVALPKTLPALLKQHPVRNLGFAAGGAVVGLMGGTALQQGVMTLLNKCAPDMTAKVMSNGIAQRVIGASFALVAGGLATKLVVKSPADRVAAITGTAAAALAEAFFPGEVARRIAKLPVIGQYMILPASPVQGLMGMYGSNELAAYVESPAYQGVGAYVESPAYQGVGAYVESPAYQGVGHLGASMDDAVAGLGGRDYLAGNLGSMGSNMPSHLDS